MRDYVIHPDYHRGSLHNDIALLFLAKPIDITENVNTVCLPRYGDIFDGSRCFASGWGKDSFGHEGKYQVLLILSRTNKIFMFSECDANKKNHPKQLVNILNEFVGTKFIFTFFVDLNISRQTNQPTDRRNSNNIPLSVNFYQF